MKTSYRFCISIICENFEHKECIKRPQVYEDTELEALLREDERQTQGNLALTLGETQQGIV